MRLSFYPTKQIQSRRAQTSQSHVSPNSCGFEPANRNLLRREPGRCACGGSCPRCQAQSNLKIGEPDDQHEREADAVAERVIRMTDVEASPVSPATANLQRKSASSATESHAAWLQPKAGPSHSPAHGNFGGAPSTVHDALNSLGQSLPSETRAFFEPRFGYDFSRVRVHTDAKTVESARSIHALAYTVGRDVVFGAGQFSPGTAAGRKLLAHELAHTVQQTEAASPVRVARKSDAVREATEEDRRFIVEAAARWLTAMADQVAALRRVAAVARATTEGSAAAPRAFHQHLNQEVLERLLNKTISVFEAQRSDIPYVNFPAESPEQTSLGEAYARAIEQFGLAMEEARTNAANLAPAVHESEERAYARNHLRWLEANPAAPLAAGIRTTFTQTELAISARRHQQVSAELANLTATVHQYDLSGNGAQRLRSALLDATYRLVRDPTTGKVEAQRDATLEASIQPVLDQLSAIERAIAQAVDRLQRAETRTRAFATDPVANPTVGNTLQAHFATRDPGYATLLADRYARMARELRGEGALTIHARNPQDPACTVGSVGGGFSVTAAHAEPNRFHFCGTVSIGDQEVVSTVVHETVHAVVPNLGARGPVTSSSDTPRDRAYAYERIYSRLSTEEALDNAESYSFYVDSLLGVPVVRPSAPSDVVTGCADADPVHDAIARATYRIRLGAMWADQTAYQHRGTALPQWVIDIVQHDFPGADAARAREVLTHLRNLASTLEYYLPVVCRPGTDREARARALVYGPSARATAGAVTATSRRYPADTLRICPDWFQADAAIREDTLTAILVLRYRPLVPVADVAGLVSLARFIQEQAHPSVAGPTLQQHQAADVAPAPTP